MSGGLDPSTAVFHYVGNIAFDISGTSPRVSYENMWRSHLCSLQMKLQSEKKTWQIKSNQH